MPAISLVVCVYREREMLERLLREAAGCYDDLVVVHDGPERNDERGRVENPVSIDYATLSSDGPLPDGYRIGSQPAQSGTTQELVESHGGRYFEGPRSFQQEPHWPFAWSRARHDWILRLDADEFPSAEMKVWLKEFRALRDSPEASGYTCIWPLWNGRKAVTKKWPRGRTFLFDRRQVRFFGMVEEGPISDHGFEEMELVLHHQPKRKSYGVRNILFRRQAFLWRLVIARSLVGKPSDLPCWRWSSDQWPEHWEQLRMRPLYHSLKTLVRYPLFQFRGMMRAGERPRVSACLNPGLHHCMLGLRVFAEMRRHRGQQP